jgi:hypothetical protein
VVVVDEVGVIGAGTVLVVSRVVVVDVTGGVEEQAAINTAAEQQTIRRSIGIVFIDSRKSG